MFQGWRSCNSSFLATWETELSNFGLSTHGHSQDEYFKPNDLYFLSFLYICRWFSLCLFLCAMEFLCSVMKPGMAPSSSTVVPGHLCWGNLCSLSFTQETFAVLFLFFSLQTVSLLLLHFSLEFFLSSRVSGWGRLTLECREFGVYVIYRLDVLYRLLNPGCLSITHSLNLYSHFQLSFQFFFTFSCSLIWARAISIHCLGHWESQLPSPQPPQFLVSEIPGIPSKNIVLGIISIHLLPKLLPNIGKAHLSLFDCKMFQKTSFLSTQPSWFCHTFFYPKSRCPLGSVTVSSHMIRR